ncbi:uncharacterized protein LOC124945216 [Impatiens glandulifera]|uniref:uncharacterized protein LOC124945216 n=1 Tax=Impatiens glandulifera TaxID=253017 RepID=UPI001FB05A43|nr:uncharacterized protein LOC124945216 [Impatiens glandulifera]
MMSKRMKLGVSLAPSSSGSYEDAKTRLKHQTLLQEYQELQMDTDIIRDNLDAIKKRKLILLAEVRFLRLKHKNLIEANYQAPTIQQQQQQQNLKKTNSKSNPRQLSIRKDKGVKISNSNNKNKKIDKASSSAAQKPFHFAKPKEKGNKPTAMSFDSSKERLISKNGSVFLGGGGGKDKAPFFDLNQISREELEFQDEEEEPMRIEEMKRSVAMTREGADEHAGELKLAMCRNMGNGNHRTTGGKRKISWQDPVALKV